MNGSVAENEAIAWFSKKGYIVSYPLGRPSHYDLIVDSGGDVQTVEVKSTDYSRRQGRYTVALRTKGGNQSWSGEVKRINSFYTDLVFVVTPIGYYLLPAKEIDGQGSMTVGGGKYEHFKVTEG